MKGYTKRALRYWISVFFRVAIVSLTITPLGAQTPTPPVNDNWDDRITLQGTSFDITGSTYGATFELGDPTEETMFWNPAKGYFSRDPEAASIWWTWTAPISGLVVLSMPPVPGFVGLVGPKFVVFTDSLVDLNTEIAGTLDVIPGYYSTFPVNAGETYGLALVGNAFTNVSYTFHIEVGTTPVILQQPKSQTVTAGEACFFTVVAPGYDTNKNIRWTHNGNTIPGANGPSLFVQNASAATAGEYRAYVNILTPTAIAVSESATLTVEGADIQPQVVLQHLASSTNAFELQVLGETNQFYRLYYSTNFTFDSQIFTGVYYPFTHDLIPFFADSALIPFNPNIEVPTSFFRAERAGDQIQTCGAIRRRVEFAKDTWRIRNHLSPGTASGTIAINNFLDGVTVVCPLGGSITYNATGTPPVCSLGHTP